LQQQTTETEVERRAAERKVISAQAEAEVQRLAGFAEAEVMRAKGYNEKDVIQAGVQKSYAEAIGNMGYDLEWLVCGRTRGEAARDMLGDNPDMLRVVADLKELQPAELAFVQKWLELYVQSLHRDQKEEA
jgi:uncharacterized membrane protein YqiK